MLCPKQACTYQHNWLCLAGKSEAEGAKIAQSQDAKQLQQCHFLFQQALDADEGGKKDEAVQLYSQAVEVAINAVSNWSLSMDHFCHKTYPFIDTACFHIVDCTGKLFLPMSWLV